MSNVIHHITRERGEKLYEKTFDKIQTYLYFKSKLHMRDFPGGTVVKNPPANARNTSSSPGAGRSHMPQSS